MSELFPKEDIEKAKAINCGSDMHKVINDYCEERGLGMTDFDDLAPEEQESFCLIAEAMNELRKERDNLADMVTKASSHVRQAKYILDVTMA